MVEIAISLAIIGIALVSIIGVLPIGMNTQRDNREETIINQDATVFMEAIRNGARGVDDLTNYVYAITNFYAKFDSGGAFNSYGVVGYTNGAPSLLTNGANIISILSFPEYTDLDFNPTNNLLNGGYSNHIVAYVRSMSGLAAEKPPQNNDLMLANTFSYRILCVNAAAALDTNLFFTTASNYVRQLNGNLHELRLTFFWPQLPNGNLGPGQQTFRTEIAGQIVPYLIPNTAPLQKGYFYQPQTFLNVTN